VNGCQVGEELLVAGIERGSFLEAPFRLLDLSAAT
jgi:hypothetical protein